MACAVKFNYRRVKIAISGNPYIGENAEIALLTDNLYRNGTFFRE
jgi:hypothetical protein